ncbi:DUF1016 N-terminal domain-containing protein [Filimonas effusa]|uniref:DUF1016 family protein n=1 Tax=Filimonas effusa TaxID=2508721 RepID=A0A4Q1D9Z4_9BACT|nr:hypothetical protein [Filimonas effusa]RXK86202.1 hypothetical protein ESB13_05180 [Filimonas effusa]
MNVQTDVISDLQSKLLLAFHNARQSIVKHASYEQVLLYWTISKEMAIIRETALQEGNGISMLELLQKATLPAINFNTAELKAVIRFSEAFPTEPAARSLAIYFDWRSIQLLLRLKHRNDLCEFLSVMLDNRKSFGEAAIQVSSLLVNDADAFTAEEHLLICFEEQEILRMLPLAALSEFRPLAKANPFLSEGGGEYKGFYCFGNGPEGLWQTNRMQHPQLAAFQKTLSGNLKRISVLLNGELNLLNLTIGRILADSIDSANGISRDLIMDHLAVVLNELFGNGEYGLEQLQDSLAFYTFFSGHRNGMYSVAHILEWSQLRKLQYLVDMDDLLVYARLLAKEKIKLTVLYQKDYKAILHEIVEKEKDVWRAYQASALAPESITHIEKTRNSEVRITESFIDLQYDILDEARPIDINANPQFQALMMLR